MAVLHFWVKTRSDLLKLILFSPLSSWQFRKCNLCFKRFTVVYILWMIHLLACSCVLLIIFWSWVCSFSAVPHLQDADTSLMVGTTRYKTADGLAASQHQPLPSAHWNVLRGKKHGHRKTGSILGSRSLSGEFPSERSRCSVCGKTFAHHHSMLRHKWKCEGTRLIVCSICGHKAHRSDHYWLHMKIHGVRRPKQ